MPTHVLNPCMLSVHREEHVVSTLLGSCIAVCLWDARLGIGGMNHYMLPLWHGRGLPTPRFGNIAIEKLIQNLTALGSRKEHLVAKVFGGANVVASHAGFASIGTRNYLLAEELLEAHGIPILAKEVGGDRAMKIDFNTKDGSVILRKVARPEWAPRTLPDLRRK
ncbi:MAG TPA: chemotaxis protein CheD [Holophagaceae bacterium]|nr:chemotaxis protein CheD [Holophagaceae bacterium]